MHTVKQNIKKVLMCKNNEYNFQVSLTLFDS